MASKPTPTQEKGAEKPRYKLLERAAFQEVGVVRGREVIPLSDVVLDPEEQPLAQALSGPFGGRGQQSACRSSSSSTASLTGTWSR
jgi:hypothetical protein